MEWGQRYEPHFSPRLHQSDFSRRLPAPDGGTSRWGHLPDFDGPSLWHPLSEPVCRLTPSYSGGDAGIDYERFARESYRILAPDSHAYFFTRFDCYPYHYHCLKAAGFAVKNCLVIEKGTLGGIGDLRGSFANNSEWLIFCQKGRKVFRHTTLLQNRKKAGTQFHKGRNPSAHYKTRFPACWFGPEYPKATYNSMWQKQHQIFYPTIKNVACLA